MRCFVVALVAVVLFAATLTSALDAPSGTYCGSYMFLIKGKIKFTSASLFDLDLKIGAKSTDCKNQRFTLHDDGDVDLTDLDAAGNCIGDLVRDNGLSDLKVTFHDGHIILDAGVGTVKLSKC